MRFRPCLGCLDLCKFEDVPLHRLALLAPANNSGGRAGSDAATQTRSFRHRWAPPLPPYCVLRVHYFTVASMARGAAPSGAVGQWGRRPHFCARSALRLLSSASSDSRSASPGSGGGTSCATSDAHPSIWTTAQTHANECTHAHAREPRLVAINASPSLPLAGSAAVRERARRRRALTCACVCGGNVHVGDGADGPHLHGDRGGGRGGGGRGRRPSTAQTLFAADGEKGFA